MSWQTANDPIAGDPFSCSAIEHVIVPRSHDIGAFEVRRALPSAKRRMVGPFIFFDQMGPAQLLAGQGMDVRPHPHIGLATVTYLFDGEIMHRDSLGSALPIRPGAINLMTAGSGIAHSERTDDALRVKGSNLFGIQSWIALPHDKEEIDPAFSHHPAESLPVITDGGMSARVIMGSIFGRTSPVPTYSESLYADVELAAGASMPLPATHEERAIYTAEGSIEIAGDVFDQGQLLVFRAGDEITVKAETKARLMIVGGTAMDGPRHIWWNFVSSSRERIEQAKADWAAGRFAKVPGEDEFIPLPGR